MRANLITDERPAEQQPAKTQPTRRAEYPVPKRRDVFDALRKIVHPRKEG